jgi:hypothetical protein
VARFLVERYWPGVNESAAAAALERVDATAAALAAEGTDVRCVHTTFVPAEESVLWIFEAATAADIERCAADARVPTDRVTESIEIAHRG